jgi:hypothetical protein
MSWPASHPGLGVRRTTRTRAASVRAMSCGHRGDLALGAEGIWKVKRAIHSSCCDAWPIFMRFHSRRLALPRVTHLPAWALRQSQHACSLQSRLLWTAPRLRDSNLPQTMPTVPARLLPWQTATLVPGLELQPGALCAVWAHVALMGSYYGRDENSDGLTQNPDPIYRN